MKTHKFWVYKYFNIWYIFYIFYIRYRLFYYFIFKVGLWYRYIYSWMAQVQFCSFLASIFDSMSTFAFYLICAYLVNGDRQGKHYYCNQIEPALSIGRFTLGLLSILMIKVKFIPIWTETTFCKWRRIEKVLRLSSSDNYTRYFDWRSHLSWFISKGQSEGHLQFVWIFVHVFAILITKLKLKTECWGILQ